MQSMLKFARFLEMHGYINKSAEPEVNKEANGHNSKQEEGRKTSDKRTKKGKECDGESDHRNDPCSSESEVTIYKRAVEFEPGIQECIAPGNQISTSSEDDFLDSSNENINMNLHPKPRVQLNVTDHDEQIIYKNFVGYHEERESHTIEKSPRRKSEPIPSTSTQQRG